MIEDKPATLVNSNSPGVNSFATAKRPNRRIIVGLLLVAFVLDVLVFYTFVTSKRVSEGDFYIPWRASQEMMFNGRNPYSEQVTELIQIGLEGRVFPPDVADRLSFNYPLYDALLLAPFTPLPYPVAEAVWNVINQFALIGLVWQLLRLTGWLPKSSVKLGLYLWAFLFYSCIFTIGWGQYTILTMLAVVVAANLLRSGRQGWAGIILALALFKPQTSALLVGFLLLACLFQYRQHWRVLFSFGLTFGLMLVVPLLWLPDWIGEWLASSAYRRLHPGMYSGAEEFFHTFVGLPFSRVFGPGLLLSGLLTLGLVWLWWWLGPDLHTRLYPQLLALTGLVTLVALPQYGGANDMALYPALIIGLAWFNNRFKTVPLGTAYLITVFLITIIGPYLIISLFGFTALWLPLRALIIVTAYTWLARLIYQQRKNMYRLKAIQNSELLKG